jgi:hypothetical protein
MHHRHGATGGGAAAGTVPAKHLDKRGREEFSRIDEKTAIERSR